MVTIRSMKEDIRKLWELCFHDSPAFTDLYFRMRYNNEVNLALRSGSTIIAAMQILPYPMTFCGQTIKTAYISGACTHPDFRGKGVMRELLNEAFGRMHAQGIVLSTLIPAQPWIFDYYARSGYAPVFNVRTIPFTADPAIVLPPDYQTTVTNSFDPQLYAYFEQKMRKRSCCIQHTADDFRVILADLKLEGGRIHLLHHTQRHETAAIAFVYPDEENNLLISELLADSDEEACILLQHICRTSGQTKLRLLQPAPENEEGEKLGMGRIINAHALLQFYAAAHPDEEWNLALTDEQLQANTSYYYLNNGHCMKNAKRLPGKHLTLTIGELTSKILTPLHPYMSLMIN